MYSFSRSLVFRSSGLFVYPVFYMRHHKNMLPLVKLLHSAIMMVHSKNAP
jgi:hypothetical protein